MPTCPRCALVAVVLAFLAFTGCDTNNPGRDLDLISGIYNVAEITFDPETADLSTADVGARLTASTTRLEIFGDDDEALFVVQFEGEGSNRINLLVSASRGRATFEAVDEDDEEDLARLLLPARFTLEYDEETPSALEATFTQSGINLQAFNPARYQGQTDNRGELTIRFEKR